MLKNADILMIAESAYKHGVAYRDGRIHRNTGRYIFKNPHVLGLPHWVADLPYGTHAYLERLYVHCFRTGFNSKGGAR